MQYVICNMQYSICNIQFAIAIMLFAISYSFRTLIRVLWIFLHEFYVDYFVICNLCTMKYAKVSDLERHIKSVHKDHEKFECENGKKSFVTKWRLDKHVKMHSKLHLRECHYFKSKSYCSFEELGCKF
jgi:hypothetical protein